MTLVEVVASKFTKHQKDEEEDEMNASFSSSSSGQRFPIRKSHFLTETIRKSRKPSEIISHISMNSPKLMDSISDQSSHQPSNPGRISKIHFSPERLVSHHKPHWKGQQFSVDGYRISGSAQTPTPSSFHREVSFNTLNACDSPQPYFQMTTQVK